MLYINSHLEDFIQKVYQDINVLSPNQLNLYTIADALDIGLYPINDISQALRFEGRDYIFLNNALTGPERFEVFGTRTWSFPHPCRQPSIHAVRISSLSGMASRFFCASLLYTYFYVAKTKASYGKRAIYKTSKRFGVTYEFAEKRLDMYKMKILDLEVHLYSKW